jgi:hypothetical protein
LPAPSIGGWNAYPAGRGIAVVTDDIGRDAISRTAARMLLTEKREAEARRHEAAERQAVEIEARRVAGLRGGVPWYEIPDGVSPGVAWATADKDRRPRRVTPLGDALSNSGSMIYRPLRDEPGDE